LSLSIMAAEYHVLPSMMMFGTPAMDERTDWHIAFDYAMWRRFAEARDKQQKKLARENSNKRR
jgi:hypothetical protein